MTPAAPPTARSRARSGGDGARTRRRGAGVAVVVLLLVMVLVGVGVALSGAGSTGRRVDGLGRPAVADPAHPLPGADGQVVDGGVSVLDDDQPAVSGLDPALLSAVRDAAADAEDDGVEVRLTSGWRSPAYQQRLLDEAVAEYGSLAEARRWVSTPQESAHVTGDAVDIGPTEAAYWFAEHGADHGLCQVYANEIWHYELLVEPDGTCPPMHEDGSSATLVP